MDGNNKPVDPAASPAPATTPVSTPTPVAQPAQQPVVGGKKNKTPIIAGAVIAALLVVGGIAYGVYAYVTNQPDYMLSKAIEQAGKESVFAGKFKFTMGTDSNGATISGDVAAANDKAAKSGQAVIGIGTGDSRVSVSARVFEDAAYLRFGSLDNLGNLVKNFSPEQGALYETPEFKAALARVNNKWFSLDKQELSGVTEGASTGKFNPDDVQKVLDIYNKHPFFKPNTVLADETIDNVKTAHFNIKIDKANYRAFLNDLKAANLESFKVTDDDLKDADQEAEEFLSETNVEVWITRDTKKFKQFKITGNTEGSQGTLLLTLVNETPKLDKLEKPTDATPFSNFMTTLLGPTLGAGLESGMGEDDLSQ